jgi:hypothetical protein
VRRLGALVAVAVTLAGCGGGGGGTSTEPVTAPPASTLPTSGTVTYTDGRVYTVAPLHTALRLDDVDVRVQIWLRNAAGAPYLAAATAGVPRNLLGLPIPAGKSVTGTLVYPAPQRETGYLLVYRFGDAKAIAKAKHVGLLAYS